MAEDIVGECSAVIDVFCERGSVLPPRIQRAVNALDEAAAEITALRKERDELVAEVRRLRNIANESGLIDPELAPVAGKPISALKVSTMEPRRFEPPLAKGQDDG